MGRKTRSSPSGTTGISDEVACYTAKLCFALHEDSWIANVPVCKVTKSIVIFLTKLHFVRHEDVSNPRVPVCKVTKSIVIFHTKLRFVRHEDVSNPGQSLTKIFPKTFLDRDQRGIKVGSRLVQGGV